MCRTIAEGQRYCPCKAPAARRAARGSARAYQKAERLTPLDVAAGEPVAVTYAAFEAPATMYPYQLQAWQQRERLAYLALSAAQRAAYDGREDRTLRLTPPF